MKIKQYVTTPDKCGPNFDIRVNFEVFSIDMWNVKMNLKNWIKTLDFSDNDIRNTAAKRRPVNFYWKQSSELSSLGSNTQNSIKNSSDRFW